MSTNRGNQSFDNYQGGNLMDSDMQQYMAFKQLFSSQKPYYSQPSSNYRGRGRGRGRGGGRGSRNSTPSKSSKKTQSLQPKIKSTQKKYVDLLKHAVEKGLVKDSRDSRNWAFNVLIDYPGSGPVFGPGLSTTGVPPAPATATEPVIWAIQASIMQQYFTLRQEKDVSDMSTYKTMVYDHTDEGKIKVLTPYLTTCIRRYLTKTGKAQAARAIPKLSKEDFADVLAAEVVVEPEVVQVSAEVVLKPEMVQVSGPSLGGANNLFRPTVVIPVGEGGKTATKRKWEQLGAAGKSGTLQKVPKVDELPSETTNKYFASSRDEDGNHVIHEVQDPTHKFDD